MWSGETKLEIIDYIMDQKFAVGFAIGCVFAFGYLILLGRAVKRNGKR